ncbi:MAG TPA: hypothetical protein VF062_19330 [Candidatus Limnocylindrales bacterium]
MSQIETASAIASQRVVTAAGLLENRADLRGYPHRYLAIHSYTLLRGEGVRVLLAATELLEQYGWSLVNMMQVDKNLYAVMRQPRQGS